MQWSIAGIAGATLPGVDEITLLGVSASQLNADDFWSSRDLRPKWGRGASSPPIR
jgi:hypothetical protein